MWWYNYNISNNQFTPQIYKFNYKVFNTILIPLLNVHYSSDHRKFRLPMIFFLIVVPFKIEN